MIDEAWQRMRLNNHFIGFGVALLISYYSLAASTTVDSFPAWRCPTNDGINTLYCYLKINHIPIEYSKLKRLRNEIVRGGRPETALSLATMSKKSGLALDPVFLSMNQLSSCPMPVIVHLDGISPDEGMFNLVLYVGSNHIDYISGWSGAVRAIDLERFRRNWSGVALLPASNRRWHLIMGLFGLAGGLVLMLRTKCF